MADVKIVFIVVKIITGMHNHRCHKHGSDSSSPEDDLEAARSKDVVEATESEELVLEGRQSHRHLAWPPLPEMNASRETPEQHASRGHHCCC
jgi:hypothetical protein